MESQHDASENALGVVTAPVGRTVQSLASTSEANGTSLRNGTIRPSTPNQDTQDSSLGLPRGAPANIQERVRRMRWSRELNTQLMIAYYHVTDRERNLTDYRRRLEQLWNAEHPILQLSAQRLTDQVRSIIRRQALSPDELAVLRARTIVVDLEENAQSSEVDLTEDAHPSFVDLEEDVQRLVVDLVENDQLLPVNQTDNIPVLVTPEIRNDTSQWTPLGDDLSALLQIEARYTQKKNEYAGIDFRNRPRLFRHQPNPHTKKIVAHINTRFANEFSNVQSLNEMCHLIYCIAQAFNEVFMKVTNLQQTSKDVNSGCPPWQRRLQTRIDLIRKEIGILHVYLHEVNPSSKVKKAAFMYQKRAGIKSFPDGKQQLLVHLESIKQKLKALGNRLRRYRKRCKRYQENKMFKNTQKLFYRNLEEEKSRGVTNLPDKEDMKTYWSGIWSPQSCHTEAAWIDTEEEACSHSNEMAQTNVSLSDISKATRKLKNWSAPGVDSIHNFWWKSLTKCHERLASLFDEAIHEPTKIPNYFTCGITYMLPKKGDLSLPQNFRPITCLPTIYKILTSVISTKVSLHLENNNIMAWEQNGCRQRSRGCKELLVIDNVITRQAKLRQRKMSVAWIDYQKAFDSVPHSWLCRILEIYKIHPDICNTLKYLMRSWRTSLNVKGDSYTYSTSEISIRRGIFQGDSLSPLWFCMALNPLSAMLNRSKYGYALSNDLQISHLFYMDDLKIYSRNKEHLQGALDLVMLFSQTIGMSLGLEKCAALHIEKGKVISTENLVLTDGTEFPELDPEKAYKYLGVIQALEIKQRENKNVAEKKFLKRVNIILKTQLNAKNKILAINTWAVPSVAYTFGILTWSKTNLESMDRKVRTLFTKHRMLHPNSAIERLYICREKGGRGLCSLEVAHQRECASLRRYFHEKDTPVNNAIVMLDKSYTPLKLFDRQARQPENILENMVHSWCSKALHGRYYASFTKNVVDTKATNTYLTSGYLFAETEGFLFSIQDQVVPTRTYRRVILNQNVPSTKCRYCNSCEESIQHLISGCTYLAPSSYLTRHNSMGKVVHQLLCQKYGLKDKFTPYYLYNPEPVIENKQVKIYWDMQVRTDRTVRANRPDMIMWYKENKEAIMIDFSVPLDDNMERAFSEKLTKYQDLAFEVKQMFKLNRVHIMPFIISANGLVHNSVVSSMTQLGISNHGILWMQKAVILGTVGIVRRALDRS